MKGVIFLAVLVVIIGCGQATLPGGWFDVATNDENVQRIADWAVAEMGTTYSLIEIKTAQKQVNLFILFF